MSIVRLSVVGSVVFTLLSTFALGVETPVWIWNPVHTTGEVPAGACYFRGSFALNTVVASQLEIAADDSFEVFVNGRRVGRGDDWKHLAKFDVSEYLVQGQNTVAVKVVNRGTGSAGLAARLTTNGGRKTLLVTNQAWTTYASRIPGWQRTRFADAQWKRATEIGPWGVTNPWIVEPLPTAQQVAALNSMTRPKRAQWEHEPDDSRVILAGANEPLSSGPRKPLLLKPLDTFPWLKTKKHQTPPGNTRARIHHHHHHPLPAQDSGLATSPQLVPHHTTVHRHGPQTITNPHIKAEPKPKAHVRIGRLKKVQPLVEPEITLPKEPSLTASLESRFEPTDGFSVQKVLGHAKTGSLISSTFDEFGQMIAGQENGPLLLFVDSDDDGELDQVKTYCGEVTNCHGVLALSGMVFVVGDGPEGTGLYRLGDNDRDGNLEEVTSLVTFDVSNAEHGPHGVVLGPDGNIYVTVGNHAKPKQPFSKLSPRRHLYEGDLIPRYEDPGGHANGVKLPAGFILRTDVRGTKTELFASGLRNSYDLAFNADGQLFTYDSDMEADSGTTWYRPTRFCHVIPGSEFGWRSGWAKWPAYYHDSVPPIATTGRGSPTGIVFYQHNTYPAEYRNVAFLADWSQGRILTARLTADGSGYSAETNVFLEGNPLNVTDLEVGPDGLLYFITGGRGTEGGLYRVAWNGRKLPGLTHRGIENVLEAPQINSSWGRQQVAAAQLQLGNQWDIQITDAASDTSLPLEHRLQALQLMQWIGPIPDADLLHELSGDQHAEIRRLAAYLMSAVKEEQIALRLLELLDDPSGIVRRQACESLVRANRSVPYEYIEPLLRSSDRFEAWSARMLLSLDHPDEWSEVALATEEVRTFIQAATTLMVTWPTQARALKVAERSIPFMKGYLTDDDFNDLIRLLQLTVVRGELKPGDVPELTKVVEEEFPANHEKMNRELVRLLVLMQATSIKDRYLAYLEGGIQEPDRIHMAIHLRFLNADWTTEETLRLFKHLTPSREAGNGVLGYLQSVSVDFGKGLDADQALAFIREGKDYPSAALAAVMKLPQNLSLDQIRSLAELDRSLNATDGMSKRLRVAILAMLARDGKDVSMAYLREVFDRDPERRLEAAVGLAEKPAGENWNYLVRSLPLLKGDLAREMLIKLRGIEGQRPKQPEIYDHVIALGLQLADNGGDEAVKLLEHWQGFASTDQTPTWNEALAAWKNWFATTYPDYTATNVASKTSPAKWNYDQLIEHLDSDALSKASVDHGKVVFKQAQCANCHRHGEYGEVMGPSLSALGKRFQTKEIVDAIVHPSQVISDQYRAKTLITVDGKTYTGIVGSGGEDELLVLQADGKKVQVPADAVEDTLPSHVSAMPEGLINSLSLDQVTDLIAFLKSIPREQVAEKPRPLAR